MRGMGELIWSGRRWRRAAEVMLVGVGMVLLLGPRSARSAEDEATQKVVEALKGIKFGMLGYLDYSVGEQAQSGAEEDYYNRLAVTRGYFRFTKDFTPWLGGHITFDVSQEVKDKDETLSGSYVTRLKYYYGYLKPPDLGPFTQMKSEIGMGHIPWLDFEEHINPYRCQGTMAIERAGVFNSADLGVSLMGNLAGRLEEAERRTGNKHYDGKYGSWHLGVYNGSGYHAVEKNQNKVFEGRVTLRPLPGLVPGLQLSYFYLTGDGNRVKRDEVNGIRLDPNPQYWVHLGMVSYERPELTLTAQYFQTRGNQKGDWIDPSGRSLDTRGYSGFGRLSIPGTKNKLSVFSRYDYFDIDPDQKYGLHDTAYTMWMAGVSYDLYQGNLLVVDYEATDFENDLPGKGKLPQADRDLGNENKWQVVFQVKL